MSTNKIKAKKDFLLVGILPSLKFSLLHCHSFWTRKKAFNVNKVWIFFPHSKQHETLKSNLWMWLKVFIQLTQNFTDSEEFCRIKKALPEEIFKRLMCKQFVNQQFRNHSTPIQNFVMYDTRFDQNYLPEGFHIPKGSERKKFIACLVT